MLKTRILTALVLVPCVLAALFALSPQAFGIASLLVVGVAAREWGRLAGFAAPRLPIFVGVTLLLGLALLCPAWSGFGRGWGREIVLTVCGTSAVFWLCLAPPWVIARWPTSSPLPMAFVGWVVLCGAWVAIVELQARSPWLLLAAMAVVWIADTAAYFTGRAFGHRKLAPTVSPGKTWEGVYGALFAVSAYALALVPLAPAAGFALPTSALAITLWTMFALLVTGVSIFGDLFESLLKRHAGVKDSGALLPGHGGVLDRTDALFAAMPLAALAAQMFLAKP
jgi:phosphatidate cytidylyltransferase